MIDLRHKMEKKKFLLISLNEQKYTTELFKIMKSIEKNHKICYVCLSRLYKDVYGEMKDDGLDTENFFFVDTLSSHYEKHQSTSKCTYVSSPSDIEGLEEAIKKVIEKNNCDILVFDTISTLLIYKKINVILNLTNKLIKDENKSFKTVYIILEIPHAPKTDIERMTNDLELFADNLIKA